MDPILTPAPVLPIAVGEVVGNLKAVDVSTTGSIMVECLVCHRISEIQRYLFRRPLTNKQRACRSCMTEQNSKKVRISITRRMYELIEFIGSGRHPHSSALSFAGARTLNAVVKLGAAVSKNGQVQATDLGLDILTQTPRWSESRDAGGKNISVWSCYLTSEGRIQQFSENPNLSLRKPLPDRPLQETRDLGTWLEQLKGWEQGGEFPPVHPRMVARLVKDIERSKALLREREKHLLGESDNP